MSITEFKSGPENTIENQENEEKSYTEKFESYIDKIAERQGIHTEEIVNEAVDLAEGMSPASLQHYEPEHMAAGSLVVASRIHDNPRTVEQLAQELQQMNGFMDNRKHVKKVRRSKKRIKENCSYNLEPVLAEDILEVLLQQLEAGKPLKKKANSLMEELKGRQVIYGKSPSTLAAAIVNISSNNEPDVEDISTKRLARKIARQRSSIKRSTRVLKDELQ